MTQKKRPCGRRFCPAAIRVIYPVEELTQAQIGAALGIRPANVGRQASWLGLPSRYADHYKPVSAARMRRLYEVENLSLEAIAAQIGCDPQTVWRKAKNLGLRRPTTNNYARRIKWPADFNQMWRAGVLIADIMQAAVTEQVDVRCVSREARRRGLPPRNKGARWKAITMDEYRQINLAKAMAKTARIEQAAFISANLADRVTATRFVGHDHAKAAIMPRLEKTPVNLRGVVT